MKKFLFALFIITCCGAFAGMVRIPASQERLYELVLKDDRVAHVVRGSLLSIDLIVDPAKPTVTLKDTTGRTLTVPKSEIWTYKLAFLPVYTIKGKTLSKPVEFTFQASFLEAGELGNLNKKGGDYIFYLGKNLQPYLEGISASFMGPAPEHRPSEPDETVTTEQRLWNEVKECLRDSDPAIRIMGLRQLEAATHSQYVKTGLDMWVQKLATDPDETESVKRLAKEILRVRKYESDSKKDAGN